MARGKSKKKKSRGQKMRSSVRRSRPPVADGVSLGSFKLKTQRFRNREYLKDIATTGVDFETEVVEINPGLNDVFPWLSGVAQNFETYVWHKLTFVYVPSVGTSTDGSIAFCPDYDAADLNDNLEKKHFLSFADSKRFPIWKAEKMSCATRNLKKRKCLYIRSKTLSGSNDIKLYDALTLTLVKTSGASLVAGELWVEYDIELQTPQVHEEDVEQSSGNSQSLSALGTPFTDTTMSSGLINIYNTVRDRIIIASGNSIQITAPGRYKAEMFAYDVTAALTSIAAWVAGSKVTDLFNKNMIMAGANAVATIIFDVDNTTSKSAPANITNAGFTGVAFPQVYLNITDYSPDIPLPVF